MYFLGDIHGDFQVIVNFARRNSSGENINLIQVGDFGVGFTRDFSDDMSYLNRILYENNINLYIVRGNHDNPYFFSSPKNLSNITFVKDYTVLEIEGRRILCVGGGISVDRALRSQGIDYWGEEKFYLETGTLKELSGIDMVVTHISPHFAHPAQAKYFDGIDLTDFNFLNLKGVAHFLIGNEDLVKDLLVNSSEVSSMYEILLENNYITHWFYGHYHRHFEENIHGTNFILLDINEFYKI